jgi:hypothetical protein
VPSNKFLYRRDPDKEPPLERYASCSSLGY